MVKIGLLLTVLVNFFARMNRTYDWIPQREITQSVVYRPLRDMTAAVFPFLIEVKEKLLDSSSENTSQPA